MITSVCLNPCIDQSIRIASFTYGGMNRVSASRADAGGKGVNVAIAAAQIGMESECIGFLAEDNNSIIYRQLLKYGVKSDFVSCEGRVRTNIKLLDESRNVVTEINESGTPVSEKQLQEMTDLFYAHAQDSDFLVLSGSMPPGCPKNYYATLIEAASGLPCRCVLDADREALNEGLKAKPFMIKPNLFELETAVGYSLDSIDSVKEAALRMIDKGVEIVVVSMGAQGALITDGKVTYTAPRLQVPVRSTVGAGDSMVAGLIAGFMAEKELDEVFAMGIAGATACVMTDGTMPLEKAQYKALIGQVQVQKAK